MLQDHDDSKDGNDDVDVLTAITPATLWLLVFVGLFSIMGVTVVTVPFDALGKA